MPPTGRKLDIGLDLLLFGVTSAMAVHYRWSTTDLVWSLWISSLTVGYSLILASIVGSLAHGSTSVLLGGTSGGGTEPLARGKAATARAALPLNIMMVAVCAMMFGFARVTGVVLAVVATGSILAVGGALRDRLGWKLFPDPNRGLARLVILLPGGLFMLGFFTFHFGLFHLVHGVFLNGFFPLVRETPVGKSPDQVFGIMGSCAREAVVRYWPFVAASALSRLSAYTAAFETTDGSMLFKPYLNVIRMHVMIFVFAFLGAAGLQSYALYPLLAAYFLPVGGVLSLLRSRRRLATPSTPTKTN
ncbi:MAG: hypothetical protein A2Y78_04695 [Acidobacteria bacterium RBG_13_68_16]|nr:MAG: hypothetical protein A2Y78_04695 [Acidobacteria bacterium RBG_13_68_16]